MYPIGSYFLIFGFISMYAYVYSGKGTWLQVGHRGQKGILEPGSCDSPKLVLGTKLWSSKRAVSPLNHRNIFPALHIHSRFLVISTTGCLVWVGQANYRTEKVLWWIKDLRSTSSSVNRKGELTSSPWHSGPYKAVPALKDIEWTIHTSLCSLESRNSTEMPWRFEKWEQQ